MDFMRERVANTHTHLCLIQLQRVCDELLEVVEALHVLLRVVLRRIVEHDLLCSAENVCVCVCVGVCACGVCLFVFVWGVCVWVCPLYRLTSTRKAHVTRTHAHTHTQTYTRAYAFI